MKVAEANARAEKAKEIAREQANVQLLTAKVQSAELKARLDALEAPRKEAARQAKAGPATRPLPVDRVQAALDAKADAARKKNESDAARIVRDVQIGAVAADEQHPYDGYAGCIYLAAKLDDGLTSAEAADRTREAVLAMMLGTDVSPEQVALYYTAYEALKERAAAAAKRSEATELFAAAEALTGGVQ
ncbi:MAG: hypothetical protein JO197_09655 [Acidobacteria bacterium]|nr:hypothetical protein [Acidobacteriota bacterium]MBV9477361.1 hypothetical protein [Acidobacteriota bacterium]